MKFRTEFVTNSSSTSFGAAAGDIVLAIAGIIALIGVQFGPKTETPAENEPGTDSDNPQKSELDAILEASEEAARQAADNLVADAETRDDMVMDILSSQENQLNAQATKIQDEINQYQKQWQEAQQGIDPNDPDYTNLKKQYDDYQDYLKNQLDDVSSQLDEIQATRIQEQIAQQSRNSWIERQQQDLVQVAEQKSFLEAVAAGYGAHQGYDIARVNRQIADLTNREKELRNILKSNNAEINYTARTRDPIGPDKDSIKLNEQYRAQKEALQRQAEAAKKANDSKRRAELEKQQAWLEKDMQNQASKAAFWNFMTKAAETTQVVADVSIDVLSKVTGPAGQSVKLCYLGLKGVGSGVGEGLAGGDMAKNVLKGAVGGLSDIVKDKIGGKFGTAVQNIYTIGSEAGKGALDAALKDGATWDDVYKGAFTGGMKGTIDVGMSTIMDGILPPGQMPDGLDWSDINTKTFINSIKSNNPLTVRNLGRESLTEGLIGAGKGQITNYIKGDQIPVTEWKQNFTDAVIDKAAPYAVNAAKAAGKSALEQARSLSDALEKRNYNPMYIKLS
jgi:phosphopantetheine adenylyltransferase